MKKYNLWMLSAILFCFVATSCKSTSPPLESGTARFGYFQYTGNDARFDKSIDYRNQYFNPVLSGFFPDPSFCRKGNDYFLVNSSFAYYPGVPIFHSTDLVNWRQLGFVLNRPSQLELNERVQISGGVYAPAITYNQYNDTFYMINTIVGGIGNFYVKTNDPFEGNWSDPVLLPRDIGIDPSFVFDDDGKAYIAYNGNAPTEPKWEGHRAIWMYEFDVEKDVAVGEPILLVDGGVDPADEPVWIEGPHIYKIDGKYYLMAAEGGTEENHSEVIFVSDNVKGPYVPAAYNPILTQRDLPEQRDEKVTCTGHADMLQTPEGDWYAVFLGCRPYEDGHFNTGRETFMLPVEWKDGFPIILPKGQPIPTVVDKKGLSPVAEKMTGNLSWKDSFQSDSLDYRWMQLRTPQSKWWWVDNGLNLKALDRSIYQGGNPAFMGFRQQHSCFETIAQLEFSPVGENDLAGLVCLQSERNNYVFGKRIIDGVQFVAVYKAEKMNHEIVGQFAVPENRLDKPVLLKVVGRGAEYDFLCSFDKGKHWNEVAMNQDGRILSTASAGGFTGVTIGAYATTDADRMPEIPEWVKKRMQAAQEQ